LRVRKIFIAKYLPNKSPKPNEFGKKVAEQYLDWLN